MKQESRSINEFSPGDIVTRIEPVVQVNHGMFGSPVTEDGNFIGEKLIFLGIANGCAYFEPTDSFTRTLERDQPISFKLYKYENGWAHYIDPNTVVDSKPVSKYVSMSDQKLMESLELAINKEDYEEASRVKHEIDKREL